MCGIVGYVGDLTAESILIQSLHRLSYRGYDSSGIATLAPANGQLKTHVRRKAGKLSRLVQELSDNSCPGNIGIGHIRWATHGKPTDENAHPHHADGITVVHNGIIENHNELRDRLTKAGAVLSSDTDTELIAHLIVQKKRQGYEAPALAIRAALSELKGAFALAILDEQTPDTLYAVKYACPLLIGVSSEANFIASDFPALAPYTNNFIILADGEFATVTKNTVAVTDFAGNAKEATRRVLDWPPVLMEKGGHKHFMHKEIFEQPRALADTLLGRFDHTHLLPILDGVNTALLKNIERIVIVACGSSFHAGLMAKRLLEEQSHIVTQVELASEFRYARPVLNQRTLVIAISQSGETADTLQALDEAIKRGAVAMAVCNVVASAIARKCEESAGTLYTRAGPEISVASTKAFVTQVYALHLIALHLAVSNDHMSRDMMQRYYDAMCLLPRQLEELFASEGEIRKVAQRFMQSKHMMFLGRGMLHVVALEGALKMKEISYIHAEGYAAGEMKHGAIALVDENMPIVAPVLEGHLPEKTLSNLEEVRARSGQVICLHTKGNAEARSVSDASIILPNSSPLTSPLLATAALQLFAYHVADLRGTDVDQPRNLAKSVTVE
jgi:glucosamine--fructose-6-phosphate aminotransferase (isomerizing)